MVKYATERSDVLCANRFNPSPLSRTGGTVFKQVSLGGDLIGYELFSALVLIRSAYGYDGVSWSQGLCQWFEQDDVYGLLFGDGDDGYLIRTLTEHRKVLQQYDMVTSFDIILPEEGYDE